MIAEMVQENLKKARYIRSFLQRGLVHTNLQLLYRCNFRCQICDYWKPEFKERPQLSLEQVERISDKLNEIGPQVVSIGGGEPLLHPEIEGVVRALARHHFPVMICNGWFITPERARTLWRAGMYEISVSVDYVDPERHDRQRGVKGAHERAVRALEVLHETRTRTDQRVHMISVIMDDNLADVEPLIQLCKRMGITYLVTLYSDGRGAKSWRASSDDVGRTLLQLKQRHPEFVVLRGYVGNFTRAIRERGIGNCTTGKNLCNIDSQGDVSLCIDRLDEPVGNMLTDDTMELVRRLEARYRENECRDCWTSCRGAIDTLMYGDQPLSNLWHYYQLTKRVPLA
jgi:MoaA/NifB/PqqE/SkfB family radical SAM enzyme